MATWELWTPAVYLLGVWLLQQGLTPCPGSPLFVTCRRAHNVVLSIASFAMFAATCAGTHADGKLASLGAFLCVPIANVWSSGALIAFYWSKYYEWVDTLFLILGGKQLSALHLIHHGITPLVTYYNSIYEMGSHGAVFVLLNTLIHTIMYGYFAWPDGPLRRFRKRITQMQITQHVIGVATTVHVTMRTDCAAAQTWGNKLAIGLYILFTFLFTTWYMADQRRRSAAAAKPAEQKSQ